MWDGLRERKLGVRILLGVFVGAIGISMLLYLVPGQTDTTVAGTEVVAQVGDQAITVYEVQTQLSRIATGGQISPSILPLYTQQIVQQLIYKKSLELEAERLGMAITPAEHAERLRQLVPAAYSGDTFIGMERYANEVMTRFQLDVPQFEALVKEGLLEQKFQQMVTDGIGVTEQEVKEEFRRRNEKIKIDYLVIKPDDLQARIQPSEAELAAHFESNKAKYTVPERRTVKYATAEFTQLAQNAKITEDDLKLNYQSNIDRYKLEDRAHVAHILFKTVGKTDAEVAEIRKKAEDVLARAKRGQNFADLARQYSEDTTKENGGDLNWINRGQTVPEFEAAAFTLPKGAISDLVKTQYGFHIIKVIDREMARTQPLEEVKGAIEEQLRQQRAQQLGETLSAQIADEIRRGGRAPIEELASKFSLKTGEARLVEANQPLPELGNAEGLSDIIFRLRPGDLSPPVQTDRGYVVFSVTDIQPSRPATLADVHDTVLSDYRREETVKLAKTRAEELSKRLKAGEKLASAARPLGFEGKTSALFSRTESVPDIGNVRPLSAAFTLPAGQAGDPVLVGANWVVYRVLQHDPVDETQFASQQKTIETELLQQKRQTAYELFRAALEARLRREGKIRVNEENIKRLATPLSS